MPGQIQISAKDLGQVALADFCPRCFWIKLKIKNRLPFQIFPGIFSSIDAYNKRIVHSWFDRHGSAPMWLSPLGDITNYRDPPHHTSFRHLDSRYDILLTGSPDAVFLRRDGAHIIADYKTAKYTGAQDALFPMYEAQLNVYARLGNEHGLNPVAALALIYMEPTTNDSAAADDGNHRPDGFAMGFKANIHGVPLNIPLIDPLMETTRELHDRSDPPAGRTGCKDCPKVQGLIALLRE